MLELHCVALRVVAAYVTRTVSAMIVQGNTHEQHCGITTAAANRHCIGAHTTVLIVQHAITVEMLTTTARLLVPCRCCRSRYRSFKLHVADADCSSMLYRSISTHFSTVHVTKVNATLRLASYPSLLPVT
eukprot:1045-Heterococcus_DN1.PRE.3